MADRRDRPGQPASSGDPAVVAEYSRLARVYDAKWAAYIRRSAETTIAELASRPPGALLDVGCGTGALLAVAKEVIPETQLTGLDPVDAVLQIARAKLGAEARLCRGWAEGLPFRSGRFPAVVCCNAFHYFSGPRRTLDEIYRVLEPGGRLVLTDWCADYLSTRILGWCLRATGKPLHRVYSRPALGRLLTAAGFRDIQTKRYRIDWLWGLMTVTARKRDNTLAGEFDCDDTRA